MYASDRKMRGRNLRISHARGSYGYPSRKDKAQFFSSAEEPRFRVITVHPQDRSLSSLTELERKIEAEIKAAKYILGIQDDYETDTFVPYSQQTLSRAANFLRRMINLAHEWNFTEFPTPQIGPADHGSIDLFWEERDRTLLINFAAVTDSASFYGKKSSGAISGNFDTIKGAPELIFWLVDHDDKLAVRRNS